MSDESRRVLDLLAQGKVSVSEAEQLLKALGGEPAGSASSSASAPAAPNSKPKYLCIHVEPTENRAGRNKGPVNIRLPLDFLRSGIKLAGIMPEVVQGQLAEKLREKGIDVSRMKPEQMDDIIAALADLNMDVDSDRSKVRIYCE